MQEAKMRICSICEDEFDPKCRQGKGWQYANRCGHCQVYDQSTETIQGQTESLINSMAAQRFLTQQKLRKAGKL
jgi:hypothetical protein